MVPFGYERVEVEWYVGEVVGKREDERGLGGVAAMARGTGRKRKLAMRVTKPDTIQ